MAQDQKQDIFFYSGMNSDDMLELVPQGDYLKAVNITNDTKYKDNQVGKIVPRRGNEQINNPFLVDAVAYNDESLIPLILRKTIGSVKDEPNNKLYYFIYEKYAGTISGIGILTEAVSLEYYSAYEVNNDKKTVENMVFRTTIKVFDINVSIKFGGVLYGNLFWVQKGFEPKSISIERAINYTAGLGVLPKYQQMTMQEFNVIKRPAIEAPTVSYGENLSVITNNLKQKLFQFRIVYVYHDNTESVWSSFSRVALPSGEITTTGEFDASVNKNYITVKWKVNSPEIKEIRLAKREYDGITLEPSNWQVIYRKSYNNAAGTDTYDFYNDVNGDELSTAESDTLLHSVPLSANSMEIIANPDKIVYAGDLEEPTDRANIATEVDLTVVTNNIQDVEVTASTTPQSSIFPIIRHSLHPYYIHNPFVGRTELSYNPAGTCTAIYFPDDFVADSITLSFSFAPSTAGQSPINYNTTISGLTGLSIAQVMAAIKTTLNADPLFASNTVAYDSKAAFEDNIKDVLMPDDFYNDAVGRTKWRYIDWAFGGTGEFTGYIPFANDPKLATNTLFIRTGIILEFKRGGGFTFSDAIATLDQSLSDSETNNDRLRAAGDDLGHGILVNSNSVYLINSLYPSYSSYYNQSFTEGIDFKKITLTAQHLIERGSFSTNAELNLSTTTVEGNADLIVAETLTPFGSYGCGIVYYDEAYRPGWVQPCGIIEIPRLGSDYGHSIVYKIKMAIKHQAPTWARYWQPVLTENKKAVDFFEIDISADPVVNPIELVGTSIIKMRVNDAINAWNDKFGNTLDSLPEYTFEKRDRIILYNTNDSSYYDKEIIKQEDEYIYISNNGSFTNATHVSTLIRIYTPKLANLEELYFEAGEINDVIQPFGRHKNNLLNTSQLGAGSVLEYTIDMGDIYLNTINHFPTIPTTEPTYNKFYRAFYPSKINSYGRVHRANRLVESIPIQDRIRWSNASVDAAVTKRWNRFDFNDYTDLGGGYGSIVGLATMGYTLKVLTELKIISIYVNRTVPVNEDGSESIILSDRTIGGISIPEYNYGCKHPDSMIKVDRSLYYINSDNGFVIRDSANGQFPINSYKQNSYFQDLSEAIRLDIAAGKKFKIFGGFIKDNGEYVLFVNNDASKIQLPVNNDYNAIVFNEKVNRWTNYATYKNSALKSPEWSDYVNHSCFTFLNGQVFLENSETAPKANYYGKQYIPEITCVCNIEPKKIKSFHAIAVHSTDKWDMQKDGDILIPPTTTYPTGMSSRLKPAKLISKEGIFYSEFLRDGLTPLFTSYNEAVINGRHLRGNVMKITLRNTEVNNKEIESELFSASVRLKLSEHSY